MIATAVHHFFHASSVFPSPGTLPVDARWSLHTDGFHDWGIKDYACNALTFNLDTILQAHDIAIRAVAFTTPVHTPRLQTNPELSTSPRGLYIEKLYMDSASYWMTHDSPQPVTTLSCGSGLSQRDKRNFTGPWMGCQVRQNET
jgi:hypothetical protein